MQQTQETISLAQDGPVKPNGSVNLLLCSVTLLTIFFLALTELAVQLARPLSHLNGTGLTSLNQYFVVSKLPEFLHSNRRADVLITGSSLFLYPSVRCDDKLAGRPERHDADYLRDYVDTYADCRYLERKLSDNQSKSVSVVNLATAASLFSDQYLVLKKSIATGKAPQVAICDISPRTFLDNHQPELDKTPVYLILADFSSLGELLEARASFASILHYAVGSVWSFYRDRADYKEVMVNLFCRLSGHPKTLFSAVNASPDPKVENAEEKEKNAGPAKNFHQKDLGYYQKAYLPINKDLFAKEMGFLRNYLELARASHIKVLAVRMPLTEENQALLPESWKADFYKQVETMSNQYGAVVCNPCDYPSTKFSPSDFEDSAHLNDRGGAKLFDCLAETIRRDHLLSR